ncbi:asparaginyl t-RNA synthetase [Acanthamoeba polyphaga moumouvirus]|uniref:asparagine--tRNA ligase n=1 Tax=Acanthamoeba polyphaga moumouvirus TaxID=1269028 RepID=L7RCX2_9VIRU|nr:asparaginyl t-RNA synthetase [Acanthamoeba polyphaga moumouvirus]AGC02177.1 asparaginyl t-RNA synthetase [Acanthamoeba polyphaga moumouvirus]
MTMQINKLLNSYEYYLDQVVGVNGWIKTCRQQGQVIFVHLSDGTSQTTLQIVISSEYTDNFNEVNNLTTGTSINVIGKLVKSPAAKQVVELLAQRVTIYQICDSSFPMQKVGLPLDFLRTLPHLRHRTNIMRAIFSIKSRIMLSIHDFFSTSNYIYVDIPALTTNACEGGCHPLQVTSLLDKGETNQIPVIPNTTKINFTQDFFNKPVYLTVSNQLHLECFAHGLGYVYTITPATRGEPSQSTKHLAHFSMLEVESCFGDLKDNMDVAENFIKYCTSQVLKYCENELKVLEFSNKGLIKKLEKIVSDKFIRIAHRDAILLLQKIHENKPFQERPEFNDDLTGEHEKFLVKHFGNPVIVMRYPKQVKAFYMPVHHSINQENNSIEYVDCFDLLMDIGEVVGGSQRIWDYNELSSRMNELNIDKEHLKWYLDLRKYGSVPHGGFGLGIERLVAVLTGMINIKDCATFPITVHHCEY